MPSGWSSGRRSGGRSGGRSGWRVWSGGCPSRRRPGSRPRGRGRAGWRRERPSMVREIDRSRSVDPSTDSRPQSDTLVSSPLVEADLSSRSTKFRTTLFRRGGTPPTPFPDTCFRDGDDREQDNATTSRSPRCRRGWESAERAIHDGESVGRQPRQLPARGQVDVGRTRSRLPMARSAKRARAGCHGAA